MFFDYIQGKRYKMPPQRRKLGLYCIINGYKQYLYLFKPIKKGQNKTNLLISLTLFFTLYKIFYYIFVEDLTNGFLPENN